MNIRIPTKQTTVHCIRQVAKHRTMGSAVSSDVIGTMDDASLTSILKEKDPARIDRLFAAARQAIRDEQGAAKDTVPPGDVPGNKQLSEEDFAAAVAAELNAVRTNPQSYIPHLEAMLTQFAGNVLTIPSEGIRLQTEEGPTAVQDCLVFLKSHAPVDYLVLEPNMSKAAVDHALDLGNNGAVSHTGSGKLVSDRSPSVH
ncbi:hypothetical protein DYB32_007263 [Aphanomyces invadans]|uniref:SCP domain-containing protein n=1 Tax=Aphanomyces invadans TaxID=157072 RepID=A0A418AP96_9STRA|nr:hypothetical protein DYB32_007263 [Aphanomyces invadans]